VTDRRPVDPSIRRQEYQAASLDAADLHPDPVQQVGAWWADWAEVASNEPAAAVLATAGGDGRPTARNVLVRGFDARGATFFTSYESRKAAALEANPQAALLCSWVPLLRQVQLLGPVARITREESEAYFAGRPRGSQIAAWASHQSSVLADRAELDARVVEAEARFAGTEVPCPGHWGGYRLVPESIELWQGRPDRLHDRLCYERAGDAWRIVRLSP
jgi:pyridoxamine 5'-phosphate oxidase